MKSVKWQWIKMLSHLKCFQLKPIKFAGPASEDHWILTKCCANVNNHSLCSLTSTYIICAHSYHQHLHRSGAPIAKWAIGTLHWRCLEHCELHKIIFIFEYWCIYICSLGALLSWILLNVFVFVQRAQSYLKYRWMRPEVSWRWMGSRYTYIYSC